MAAEQFDELRVPTGNADSRLRFASGRYFYSREAVRARELDALSRAALANSAISLGLLGEQGKLEEAIEVSEDVLAMMPRFAVTHYALALAHLRNGDPQQGLLYVEAGDAP